MVSEQHTVRQATLYAAFLGPAIAALPYICWFMFDVASHGSGLQGGFAGFAAAAFYLPIVLIAAYVAAIIPAAVVGGTYAYTLRRWPQLDQSRASRTAGACSIAFVICLVWSASFGQLKIAEFIGRMQWTLVACGVFAAAVLVNIGTRSRAAA